MKIDLLPHILWGARLYIMNRLCQCGGFCFYRLEEPNGSDTYYAIASLKLLGMEFRDQNTVIFLKNMQHDDGSYDSIQSAFYSLVSLDLLQERPKKSPENYIDQCLENYTLKVDKLPADVSSIFYQLRLLVDLYCQFLQKKNKTKEKELCELIAKFRNSDGGFGYPYSSITDTAYALYILKTLSCIDAYRDVEHFIRTCEDPLFGFTEVPGSSLSFIEYIHAGLWAEQLLDIQPRFAYACMDFIIHCRRKNGGFSRAGESGIATLENTYHALSALLKLKSLCSK
ncbi:MAG: hypothetical protein N2317_01220 [Syntrophales bacterium]|nr:hypothetical protein [Syntrophales bacterium]